MDEERLIEERVKIIEGQIISIFIIQTEAFNMLGDAIKDLKQRIKQLEEK